jgi:hypothetical protein
MLAIVLTGAVAFDGAQPLVLDGRPPVRVSSSSPPGSFSPPGSAAALPDRSRTEPEASAAPAATAPVHSIAVQGGGFDSTWVPPADRGPLGSPRMIGAAAPAVTLLDPTTAPVDPTTTPSHPQ